MEFLDYMKFKKDDIIEIERRQGGTSKTQFPGAISFERLFTEVLDILGKPGRRFYEFLSIVA
jgi:hypothetical protein